MKKSIQGLIMFSLLAGGCAIQDGRPPVATFSVEPEYKLKSATHWQVVANDIANHIERVSAGNDNRVFVPANSSTVFGRVFSSQLRSSLISKGVAVSSVPDGAIRVSVAAEEVQHVSIARYAPGTLTALGAGVLVLGDAADGRHNVTGALGAVLVAADVAASLIEMQKRPTTEIVLTTSMERDGRFLLHRSDTYYVDEVDTSLFTVTGKQFAIVGGGG